MRNGQKYKKLNGIFTVITKNNGENIYNIYTRVIKNFTRTKKITIMIK